MQFRLFLHSDLYKAEEPSAPKASKPKEPEATPSPAAPKVPGGQDVDYVESETPPPGNLGQTEGGYWRVPKGTVNPKSGKVENAKAEKEAAKEEMSKDPLKAGKDVPEGSDLRGAAEAQKAPKITSGTDYWKQQNTENAGRAAKRAEGASDEELAKLIEREATAGGGTHTKDNKRGPSDLHRHLKKIQQERQAGKPTLADKDKPFPGQEPTAAFTSTNPADHADTDAMGHYQHAQVAEKLGDKKLAKFHRDQARSKAKNGPYGPNSPVDPELSEKLRAAGMEEDAKYHADMAPAQVTSNRPGGKPTAQPTPQTTPQTQPAKPQPSAREQLGNAKTMLQDPNAKFQQDYKQIQAKKESEGAHAAAGKNAAAASAMVEEKQQAREKLGRDKTQISVDQLRQQQIGSQKRAIEDFHAAGKEHEKATTEYKKQGAEYEAKLKEHADARKQHAKDLKDVSNKLKDVKAGKPVKDDKKLKDVKKQMKELRLEAARHKDELSPKHEEHKKGIDKVKEQIGKHQEALSAQEKKVKAHEGKKPMRKPEESAEAWEKRASAHAAKGKKLKNKQGALEKKGAALSAQHKVLQRASDDFKNEHDDQQKKYREELRKLAEKHDAIKEKIDTAHSAAMKEHKKKVESAQSEVAKQREAKNKLPEKPEKPKAKEPEAPPGAPKSDEEKMSHGEHQANARKMRETIETHLTENQDLDDASRKKLAKLHEQASYHESLQHVPTKDHSKELRELGQRTKQMGADRPHAEIKAEQEEKAAKEKEKTDKEFTRKRAQAEKVAQQEQENTPRPPQNEFDRGEILNHTEAANTALDNIHSHMDSGDVDDETRTHLEAMASKLEDHAKLNTVPTKEQVAELKKIQSLTKEHSGKNFHETTAGKEAVATPPAEKTPTASKTAARSTGSNALSLYNRGAAFGSKMGAAAASPYGGAGTLADTVNYAGQGAASAGHLLLNNNNQKKTFPHKEDQNTPQDLRTSPSEEKEMQIAARRAKPKDQTAKSLWVRV